MRTMTQSTTIALAFFALIAGCGSDNDDSMNPDAASVSADRGVSEEVCEAVDVLEASLDRLEDSESIDEYKDRIAQVRADFESLRNAGGGKYAAEVSAFETALDEFEESLTSLDDGGLISGMLDLAGNAAELAVAGDRLDDAIDCD